MSFIDNDVTDLFCGCGGSSEGASNVPGVNVKYAMNHWRLAVDSHNENHPDTHHDCADISETHPLRYARTSILIGSPECTNHSLAKGKRRKNLNQGDFFKQNVIDPAAVRSRATMWDIPRFAEVHNYECIITENVVDVRDWIMFDAWLKAMHSLGYKHKCVYLNAQFAHGENIQGFAPQSRDRIYIVFWKKGNPEPDLDIRPKAPCLRCGEVEAIQAWKPGRKAGKYKTQYLYRCPCCGEVVTPYYYAAINALDLSLPMTRIGDREKLGMRPLSHNTIARIEYGLQKFGLRPTILDLRNQSGNVSARIRSAELEALNAQTTGFSSYMFAPFMFNMSFSSSKSDRTYGMNNVFPTQTTQESMGLVTPFVMANRKNATPKALDDVIPSVVGRGSDMFMVAPAAMLTMRGSRSLEGLTDPLPTQVAAGIQNWLVSQQPMMLPYYGKPQAHALTETLPTIRTKESHSFLETGGQPKIEDCYFRMLEPSETAKAQGFPDDYIILGNKEQRQKQIGNANPPPTMQLLVQRCVESLRRQAWV